MLSTLIITRDSAPWLPFVLANVRPWTDELVVVVDAATTDASADVARPLADAVVRWPVGGYIELILQAAVTTLCHGDWILRLDDDELLPADFADSLSWLLSRPTVDDFAFRRLLLTDADHMAVAPHTWPDYQIRLRTADAYRAAPWPTHIHGQPPPRLRYCVATDSTTLWHLSGLVRTPTAIRARMAYYHRVMAETGVVDANADYRGPWTFPAPPGQRPPQLDDLLAALGGPTFAIAQEAT